MSVSHLAKSGGIIRITSISFNMKVCGVFSLESPHRGNSNEYTQYTIFNTKNERNNLNYPKAAAMGFFKGTQERVRNSCGKRDINVRATEGLLYITCCVHYSYFGTCYTEQLL